MTELDQLLRRAAAALAEAQVPSPQADAELLVGHVLGISRGEVQAAVIAQRQIQHDAAERLTALVAERARRIPLQHLTGRAPFRSLELRVGPGVFIPRPETETIVELVLQRLGKLASGGTAQPRVVDLGTGSGAIAASLAAEFPQAEVHAVEVSAAAAAWAEQNFESLPAGAAGITLHRCDLRDFTEAGFDVVVSNPPYIPPGMVPAEAEVREHDPEIALYGGGADGLQLPRAVIETAKRILKPGGWFILEHAEVQAEALSELCAADPELEAVSTHQDLTGRDRATSAVVKEYSA
ncbi:peptide chain release factor N(5)-glutamine methyltransferase [Nesterenkonia alkaliphila]|uniref:Release factor glutamine methyltransferase n=1 Tax=Nesterenkonia alkaliphila TaxID=1463631 RepID=A0A7K1UFU6_9MICC|nr:peptide chain release factor N(5)-glutamine methyltransferase [Nesterenkonia alkaliphila]MVT25337.1 peptide chain release factor N(5)-glutamine methyltransferase [Nesterenkonia alkaliphila]GFZ94480.1 protein-(glutamine-N5) methyltransferase, release factor-specific [Nesterenkonia alkaliphila]